MYYNPIVVSTLVNYNSFTQTIVDIGYLTYRLYNLIYTLKQNLERIKIKPFYIKAFDGEKAARPIQEVVAINIDLEGY